MKNCGRDIEGGPRWGPWEMLPFNPPAFSPPLRVRLAYLMALPAFFTSFKIIDQNIVSWGKGMMVISAIIEDLKGAGMVVPTISPFSSLV